MAIQILPHADEWRDAVSDFNARMSAGGSPYGFYVDPKPRWIAPHPDAPVWREYYVVVEDGKLVRAGYALKPQEWWVRGAPMVITDSQGPFSEGAIDRRFGALGLRVIRDMLKRRPHTYSWGHGGGGEQIVQLIEKMGWTLLPSPFCLRVLRPTAFLRKNAFLRSTQQRRLALDLLAATGLGEIGLRGLHLALRARTPRLLRASAEVVPRFGEWADRLWEAHKNEYTAIAVRDARMMNTLVPETRPAPEWSEPVRLRIRDASGADVGWAIVMARTLEGHHRFGSLRVGTLADYFAAPDQAARVIQAATRHLRSMGAELVIANQTDPRWIRGFQTAGWLTLEAKRFLALSPALREALEPIDELASGLFVSNFDGHGPMGM